jgi:hypothetical protein
VYPPLCEFQILQAVDEIVIGPLFGQAMELGSLLSPNMVRPEAEVVVAFPYILSVIVFGSQPVASQALTSEALPVTDVRVHFFPAKLANGTIAVVTCALAVFPEVSVAFIVTEVGVLLSGVR